MTESAIVWSIAGLTAAGVVARPFRWPEAIWAVLGGLILVAFQLIGPYDALAGIAKGIDVYLFLVGMMLLCGFRLIGTAFSESRGQAFR
jgi:arsenical pump membrane protein